MTSDSADSNPAINEFEDPPAYQPEVCKGMAVNLEGYEGPLDVLLVLARTQKVDLKQISILQLSEQYLAFIRELQNLKLEVAADYLVMAAWLAYLKSRLLLPPPHDDGEVDPEELAARLVFRLQCLEAMRNSAAKLMARDLWGVKFSNMACPRAFGLRGQANIRRAFMICSLPTRPSVCETIIPSGHRPKWMY